MLSKRLAAKLTAETVGKDASGLWGWLANVNFLYFAPSLFAFCVVLMVVISLLTKAPSEEQLKGLTFASLTPEDRAESRASWNKWDVINTFIILGIIVCIMIYFSPLGVAR